MACRGVSQNVPIEYHEFIIDLRDELKKTGFVDRVEYVGSMYKGTSIGSSDFDDLFVKRTDAIIADPCTAIGFPEHAILRDDRGVVKPDLKRNAFTADPCPAVGFPEHAILRDDRGVVKPDLKRNAFKGEVQKAINRLGLADKIKLVDSGPAVAAQYYTCGWRMGGNLLFSADLDFCFDVRVKGKDSRNLYVAKKPKDFLFSADLDFCFDVRVKGKASRDLYVAKKPNGATGDAKFAWKLTTDLVEKAKIKGIDSGNGIGRWAVRILKALKKKEPNLRIFKSCMFEQVLYHLKDEHRDPSFWRESNLPEVIKAMLEYIIRAIRGGKLKHYFTSEDMLPSMNAATKENVLNRLGYHAKHSKSLIDSV